MLKRQSSRVPTVHAASRPHLSPHINLSTFDELTAHPFSISIYTAAIACILWSLLPPARCTHLNTLPFSSRYRYHELYSRCQGCRHLELDGAFMPFSRGCSFYRVNEQGQIVWARDCVEASPPKPGDATISGLGALLPVLRGVGVGRADPAQLTEVPFEAAAVWLFYAGTCRKRNMFLL